MKLSKKKIYWIIGVLGFILLIHLTLPFVLVRYVNKILDNIPEYTGSVEWIHVNLFRGAYQIHSLEILKEGETLPEPFFASSKVDLSIEWQALFHGEIVGEIVLINPSLVFIPKSDSTGSGQTGDDVDWTKPITDLMPLQINRFEIVDGEIHYADPAASPEVDVYLHQLNGLATNLNNATDNTEELPSFVNISATSLGEGILSIEGGLNIIKQTPDFDLDLSFEKVDLVALNDFIKAYAKADISEGTLNFYSEISGKDGELTGYIKPLFQNLKFIDWKRDKKKPLELIWEFIAGSVAELFENQKEDQLATRIPIQGRYDKVDSKVWPSIGNVLKNAFIRAFQERTDDSIDFGDVKQD